MYRDLTFRSCCKQSCISRWRSHGSYESI